MIHQPASSVSNTFGTAPKRFMMDEHLAFNENLADLGIKFDKKSRVCKELVKHTTSESVLILRSLPERSQAVCRIHICKRNSKNVKSESSNYLIKCLSSRCSRLDSGLGSLMHTCFYVYMHVYT